MVEISSGSPLGSSIENAEITDNTITDAKLLTKTSYVSLAGSAFHSSSNNVNFGIGSEQLGFYNPTTTDLAVACVNLPHGAVITGVVVYSQDSADNWKLYEKDIDSSGALTEMAGTTCNTEDTTITNATVDNSANAYFLEVSGLNGTGDNIYGARITYTTKHI